MQEPMGGFECWIRTVSLQDVVLDWLFIANTLVRRGMSELIAQVLIVVRRETHISAGMQNSLGK